MKKLIVILLFVTSLLTSCKSNIKNYNEEKESIFDAIYQTDDYLSNRMLDKILKAINEKDKNSLLSLFAPNVFVECPSIETQTDVLFAYCTKEATSYKNFDATMSSETINEDGHTTKVLYPTYDIKTCDGGYRITFKLVTKYTADSNNEGLWSLYVTKAKEDPDISVAYRGDNEYTTGIIIDVKNTLFED